MQFKQFLAAQMKDPEFAAAYREISGEEDRLLAKRQRLEQEVVKAAREFAVKWRAYLGNRATYVPRNAALHHETIEARISLCDAVLALEAFEAEQERRNEETQDHDRSLPRKE